jgi:hypothetical protein
MPTPTATSALLVRAAALSLLVAGAFLLPGAEPAASRSLATITVNVEAPLGGSIRSTPPGIDCPPTCTASLLDPVTLTAVPSSDYWTFGSWQGDCAPSPVATCLETAGLPFTASVSFKPAVLLQLFVSGAGRVTSSPPGIDPETGTPASASCSSLSRAITVPAVPQNDKLCEIGYRPGEQVTLTAQGIGGTAALQSWGWYTCPEAKTSCTVTTEAPGSTIRPAFSGALLGMVVEGSGKVTSTPAGIDCGTVCVGAFDKGSTVHLSAAPLGDPFFEWSPPCGTLPECDMPLVNDAIFGASFGAPFQLIVPNIIETVNMTLGIGGLGHGRVTLADAKGSKPCPPTPSTCVVPFAVPDLVTMTIAHDATSRFDRWLSSCPAAASTCTVDTQVVDSAALCIAPLANPSAIASAQAIRSGGQRRIKLALADLPVKAVTFSLARRGVVRTSWRRVFAELPPTIQLTVPRALVRGQYSLRARIDDVVGCSTTLAPRSLVLPRP